MTQYTLVEGNQKNKRYLKLYKSYNEEFLQHIVKALTQSMDTELNLKGTMKVMQTAQKTHLRKRVNLRQMVEFCLKGVIKLREEVESVIQGKLKDNEPG